MTCDDPPTAERLAVARLDDANLSWRHDNRVIQRNGEQQCVDAVGAGWNYSHLRAALTLILQECPCILEGIARHDLCNDAPARQWFAVTGFHAPELALRNRAELHQFHLVLPGPKSHMQPGRQRIRLVAGFAVQCDDPTGREAAIDAEYHEFLRHDSNAVVRNQDDAAQAKYPTVALCENQHDDHARDDVPVT